MRKIILFAAFVFLLIPNVFADAIKLKSGQEFEGKILERTPSSVKIDFNGVQLTYSLDEVEKINNEAVLPEIVNIPTPAAVGVAVPAAAVPVVATAVTAAPVVPATAPAPAQTVASPVSVTNAGPTDANEIVVRNERAMPASAPEAAVMDTGKRITREPAQRFPVNLNPKKLAINPAIAGAALLILFFLILVFYVYSSLCLQFIAAKTAQGPVWMAWVPIANLFLMCKIGKVPYVYLFFILGGFIPIIGLFFTLGFSVFIWYKIALARNKPGWIGVLCFIPLVNFVIMGYLAFSE